MAVSPIVRIKRRVRLYGGACRRRKRAICYDSYHGVDRKLRVNQTYQPLCPCPRVVERGARNARELTLPSGGGQGG